MPPTIEVTREVARQERKIFLVVKDGAAYDPKEKRGCYHIFAIKNFFFMLISGR
jgi:hypothetical protein